MQMLSFQFLDHDLTFTPLFSRGDTGEGIPCCGEEADELRHPACFPIPVPPDDPVYRWVWPPRYLSATPPQQTQPHLHALHPLSAWQATGLQPWLRGAEQHDHALPGREQR